MRHALLIGVSALAALLMVACERQATNPSRHGPQAGKAPEAAKPSGGDEEPLLLLDDEPPLLLDDGDEETPPKGPVADNSRCHVCHLDYKKEKLARVHARAEIGCADCHGDSDAHIADESWADGGNGTAPDTMFPKPKINPFCLECHPKDEIGKKKDHKKFFAGTVEEKYCTDCHGDHRLPERKCKWK
jgi:hypothetical protein